jgi:hypothetical protein
MGTPLVHCSYCTPFVREAVPHKNLSPSLSSGLQFLLLILLFLGEYVCHNTHLEAGGVLRLAQDLAQVTANGAAWWRDSGPRHVPTTVPKTARDARQLTPGRRCRLPSPDPPRPQSAQGSAARRRTWPQLPTYYCACTSGRLGTLTATATCTSWPSLPSLQSLLCALVASTCELRFGAPAWHHVPVFVLQAPQNIFLREMNRISSKSY